VTIGSLLDFLPNVPPLPHAACRQKGAALLFDAALTGEALAVDRALCCCNLCPEKGPCGRYVDTLSPKQRQQLGVVANRDYTTPPKRTRSGCPDSSPDGPGQTKSAGVG
jgi:hypothetical protein